LPLQIVEQNEELVFSVAQNVFNSIYTDFIVTDTFGVTVSSTNYTVTSGKITFNTSGNYIVTMSNQAISSPTEPAFAIFRVEVREKPLVIEICAGDSLIFSVDTITGGGTSPSYKWVVNGVNMNVNDTVFGYKPMIDSTIVCCYILSNEDCADTNYIMSQKIIVRIDTMPILGEIMCDTSFCAGSYIEVYHPVPNGVWSKSNNNVNISHEYAISTPATARITGVSEGQSIISYTVTNGQCTATVTNGQCTATVTKTVNIKAVKTPTIKIKIRN
jgi:hypothetical protein